MLSMPRPSAVLRALRRCLPSTFCVWRESCSCVRLRLPAACADAAAACLVTAVSSSETPAASSALSMAFRWRPGTCDSECAELKASSGPPDPDVKMEESEPIYEQKFLDY